VNVELGVGIGGGSFGAGGAGLREAFRLVDFFFFEEVFFFFFAGDFFFLPPFLAFFFLAMPGLL
jgi:hypothetical protein